MTVLLYLVVDVSGSTVRRGFHGGVVRALPGIVGDLERTGGDDAWLSMITYSTEAAVLIPLTRARDVQVLPAPRAGGFSSLAAALRLLVGTVGSDAALLRADGLTAPEPTVLVVADGLPTDRDEDVLAARDAIEADLHLALPADVPALAAAGLRGTRHPLTLGTPEEVAASVCDAARRAVR
ncbi:vWA domain-containing protein [Asanoa siamensis]|uniref:VWFA domain-containing protein n=1 Tax=Asanoa siamensis TaxID=926357 RepID=A0ABQ4CR76_9ACTN|nr:vWA domain-containing protein [Asanoa siamensis]GIF73801.1 hypothetical protein Asi02nite_33190 [Asanoa siamensis]